MNSSIPVRLCTLDKCKSDFSKDGLVAIEIHALERMIYHLKLIYTDQEVWIKHSEGSVRRFNALTCIQSLLNENADYFSDRPIWMVHNNICDEMIGSDAMSTMIKTNMGWTLSKDEA
jgi:hypothetical protein